MFVVRTSVLIFLDLSAATLRNRVFGRICGPKRNISKKPGFWPPCDSEKPGFWPNLRAQTKYCREKPGFWPPCDSEKPGFWPNLRAQTKELEKTRFLAPCTGFKGCDSEKPGFWPNLRAQTKELEKTRFLAFACKSL